MEIPTHPHNSRFAAGWRVAAMEKLSAAERALYDLLRSEISDSIKERQDATLKAVSSLVSEAMTRINAAATRIKTMRMEFSADIGDLRLDPDRLAGTEMPTKEADRPSSPTGKATGSSAKPTGLYVPPQARGKCGASPGLTPPGSPRHTDASNSAPRVELPRFDGSMPQLWQSRCEDYFQLWNTPQELWISYATAQFEGAAARWLESVKRRALRVTWAEFCELLQNRFGSNQHQALIRCLFHIT